MERTSSVFVLSLSPLSLISFLLLLLPATSSAAAATITIPQQLFKDPNIKYHNGPLLTGDINLSILWYGGKVPETFVTFIKSLKDDGSITFDPKVSDWWKTVESYQSTANKNQSRRPPSINVNIVSKIEDPIFSLGHEFTKFDETIPDLVRKATNGNPDGSSIAVIVIGEGVNLPCGRREDEEKCYEHGIIGNNQIYIVIKNLLRHCGWVCAWPFHKQPEMFQDGVNLVVDPPTWDYETHLNIIHFASALVSTVTNPYGNGFYAEGKPIVEIGDCCSKAFGTGYFPGFTGRVHVDPHNGGTFNAHGVNDTRFMVPGLWNPKHSSTCWTAL
ncbi:hypothetical protein M9H77_28535 [Catharanthus roseus]|uniref:Uncharacterized protein n=1 Tax=Catharanthus roseus TaxID=4058 RepID=A0ACC0AFL9_CATRO|nr:hypothetical protein M9H77_28535 [Catharanthus roseus]